MPLCKLSPEEIKAALARIEAGESIHEVARSYTVTTGALRYHRRGGSGAAVIGAPWRRHFARCNRLLATGQYCEARKEAQAAVAQIERFVPVAERD